MDNLRQIARRAMLEHGLQPDFPAAALQSLNTLSPTSESGPRDLRARLWCSIDNDDSRDLDQLTVAEPLTGGAMKILVAIADVDSLVKQHSSLDDHASVNTTSVYTAAQVFPMLPEKLSTDLTSLNEGELRLAMVVEMSVAKDGEIVASDVYHASVFNQARLTYNAVAAWLDGKDPAPGKVAAVAGLDQQLRMQDQAAQALRSRRRAQGALNLETVEARPVFKDEALTDLRADEKNRAKDMIEDFMVAANGVVARFLDAHGRASLRRTLRSPERWSRIVGIAKEHGGQLPAAADSVALNQFLAAQRESDPKGFPDLSLSIIKLLGAGQYAVELPDQKTAGHFGLAMHDYTHSTAPNRRFPDLVTQRLIKAALSEQPSPYSPAELQALATHCNEQERNAAKVERQVRKAASAILLSSRVGQRFSGVITGASEKGTWIRIAHPVAEGKIVRGSEGLDVGDRASVELIHVDVDRGFIDFARSN